MEIILSDDFGKREYNEKSSFFRALVETGSKEPIPVLRKMVNKKGWFQKAKTDEMRQCAASALKMMEAGGGASLPKEKNLTGPR
jgi:hypothetical protein